MNKVDRMTDEALLEGAKLNPMHPGAVSKHSANCIAALDARRRQRRKGPVKPAPKSVAVHRQVRTEAKRMKRQQTREIREAVMERAGGKCEANVPVGCAGPLQMDHVLGGVGRRRQRQSVDTCWMLCEWHHHMRTRNEPSAQFWRDSFRLHCALHCIPVPKEMRP